MAKDIEEVYSPCGWCAYFFFFPCCFPKILRKSNHDNRLFVFAIIFWIIAPFLITGLTVRFAFHHAETWRVFPNEERYLTSRQFVNDLWCLGVKFKTSNKTPLFSYLSPDPPKLNVEKRVVTSIGRRIHVDPGESYRFSAFLLPQSTLSAGICTKVGAYVNIIRGDKNLTCALASLLSQGYSNPKCTLISYHFDPKDHGSKGIDCDEFPWPGVTLQHKSYDEPSQIHVVYWTKNATEVFAYVTVNRSSYDVPAVSSIKWCNTTQECSLRFYDTRWKGSRSNIIFQVGDVDRSSMEVSAMCIPNLEKYILFLVIPPLLLIIIVVIMLLYIHFRGGKNQKSVGPMERKRNADSLHLDVNSRNNVLEINGRNDRHTRRIVNERY